VGERVTLGKLWALMLTVFVDMVGFLMIMPVAPLYAKRLGASAFVIGLMVSVYAVAQLATAPAWGRLSDGHGRRPMLMLGVVIAAVAHAVFGLACSDQALALFDARGLLALLFLSRFVQGAGGASTAVVQAYIADTIVPEERAKALGWISAATSAGVMIGPAIGSAVTSLGPAAPGFIAAGLCLVNLVFVARYLPESASDESRHQARRAPRGSLSARMLEVLAHPHRPVARLILIYGIAMMAFMAMNAMLVLFLQARYGFTDANIGYVYTAVGTVSLVMRSLVLGPAVRRFGERATMRLGLVALVVGFVAQPLAPHLALYALALLFIPIGTALLFPAETSLVSRYSERHELGATMGVQQAYGGVARLVGPLWAGAAFEYLGTGAPFFLSAALVAATFVFALGLEPPPVDRTAVARAAAPGG
jgi:MFS family permease